MLATKLLIVGGPKGGTALMLAAPSAGIDLPLKILVWEDGQGKVWVSYNSSDYLKERHGLPQELLQNIAVVETLAAKAGEEFRQPRFIMLVKLFRFLEAHRGTCRPIPASAPVAEHSLNRSVCPY